MDNLLYANCDSWTSMHCRHTRDRRNENISFNYQPKRKPSGGFSVKKRARPSSAQLMRSMDDKQLNNSRSSRMMKREMKMSHEILEAMTDRKAPYKVMCKIGPSCKNHDWNIRSPLKKVCTRGPNCPNHDWDTSMMSTSMRSSFRKSVKSSSPARESEPVTKPAVTEPREPSPPREEIVEVV